MSGLSIFRWALRAAVFAVLVVPDEGLAQEPWVLQDGTVKLPVDICEAAKTCMSAATLGLPPDAPLLVIPDWGAAKLQEMGKADQPPGRLLGYAEGLSAKTLNDWSDDCECCLIKNGEALQTPAPGLVAEFFKDAIVVQER
jgi:hypothetical protein